MTTMTTDPQSTQSADLARLIEARPSMGSDRLAALRDQATTRFHELGIPTTKHEDWKYTRLDVIRDTDWSLVEAATLKAEDIERFLIKDLDVYRLVFVNGYLSRSLSDVKGLPEKGVVVAGLGEPIDAGCDSTVSRIGQLAKAGSDEAFTALNEACFTDGLFVEVADGVVLDKPVHAIFITQAGADPVSTQLRHLISVGENAQATIIEHYVTLGQGSTFTNAVTELEAGDSSVVEHYRIEDESREAQHITSIYSQQGSNSFVASHTALLGGKLACNNVRPVLNGEHADCLVNGLYIPTGEQHMDNHMLVHHARPNCDSRQFYKGVLMDKSRGVFSGRIIVDQIAQKTDAKQTNANLLLSDDAQANTKPQLEIYADDVKCTHGATIGELDEKALFYLQSRGISRDAAESLLTYAFAAECLDRMKLEPIRDWLQGEILDRLPGGGMIRSVLN